MGTGCPFRIFFIFACALCFTPFACALSDPLEYSD